MRKNVALILALVMIFSMIPMTAFADVGVNPTSYTTGAVPRLQADSTFDGTVRLQAKVDGDFNLTGESNIQMFVGLPNHVTADVYVQHISGFTSTDGADLGNGRNFNVSFDPTSGDEEDVEFRLDFTNIEIGPRFNEDEVEVELEFNKYFTDSVIKIADIVDADLAIQMEDINFISAADIVNDIADIRITENIAGATDDIELTLPRGFYWDDNVDSVTVQSRFGGTGSDTITPRYTDNVDNIRNQFRTVVIPLSEVSATVIDPDQRSSYFITSALDNEGPLRIRVDETRNPAKGDVVVDVDGADPDEMVVARYGDYLATATALSTPTVFAGQQESLGEFEIREDVADSLAARRTITLTLPVGVKWDLSPEGVDIEENGEGFPAWWSDFLAAIGTTRIQNFVFDQSTLPQLDSDSEENGLEFVTENGDIRWQLVDAERRTIRATIDTESSTVGTREGALLIFEESDVIIAPDYRGPIDVEVGGSAGASGTITLAEVVPAVEVSSAAVNDIIIGAQNQELANITITETAAGAAIRDEFQTGIISLRVPDVRNAVFSATPVAEVVEGDIMIERVWMSADRRVVNVQVQGESDEASSIELSNLAMTLDRTAPEGELFLEVTGDAIISSIVSARHNFFQSDVLDTVVVANVLDRAPLADVDEAAQVAFTVGSTSYTVNGEMRTMDVAPFISNDRMMIPVRYLEYMFGMQPNWNETTRTVTVRFDGDVYGMAIGSNMITMNGADYMEMDATAEIVNDRTFVPASRFARAMGVSYEWDPVTQTATFN